MINIKGQVEIRVLDAVTLEVLDVKIQDNVITRKFYNDWANTTSPITTYLYISTINVPNTEDWIHVRGCDTTGFLPSGVTSPRFYAAAGADPAYIQITRRFGAPAATRQIYTVLLSTDTNTETPFTSYRASAYVTFSTPCTQTSSQILDVYYRMQASSDTTYSYNNYAYSAIQSLNALYSLSGTTVNILPSWVSPIYSHVSTASNISPTLNGAMIPNFTWGRSTGIAGTATASVNGVYGYRTISWTYTTAQGVGDVIGALSIIPNESYSNDTINRPAFTTTNITAPSGSAIQPIFSHANSTLSLTTANPFLDTIPSSGTGTLSFSGTWTTGNFPELYKIDIVTGGNVGTATYRFSKRNHVGFCGATYVSNVNGLPGMYTVTNSGATGIFKPHCGVNSTNQDAAHGFGQRIEKYDSARIISYDQTGLCRYNCITHVFEYWDSTTTPQLNVTNVRQVAVNPGDGTIWVACANTGIYQISADGTTVTNFTTTNGLPSNNCYAIDIGRANAVWAVCNGGIVTSANNGVSWTTYNSSTSPAFNSSVLNTDWSSVQYIRVDPTHVDDRMAIVRYEGATLNTTTHLIWWSRATGAVVNTTYSLAVITRRFPSTFNVSDTDGLWVMINAINSISMLTYGTSTSAFISSVTNMLYSVMFVRNSANTADQILLISSSNRYDWATNLMAQGGYTTYFSKVITILDSSLAVVASVTHPNTAQYPSGWLDTIVGYVVYLGNGMIAGLNATWSGTYGAIYSISGDGTPTGGSALEYLMWQKYGWNGSAWVLGNAGAKTTHSDAQLMSSGINAIFTNGATGTSFITGDYYTGGVNDGVLKNNAMTLSGSADFYVIPAQNLTDFDGVIRTYPWTTGSVVWRKAHSALTVNEDNSLTNNIPYRSYSMSAGSKNRLFGDFSISGTFTANSNQYYSIGLRLNHISEIPYLWSTFNNEWSFALAGTAITVTNSVGTVVATPPAMTNPNPIGIGYCSSNDSIYAANYNTANVSVINPNTNAVVSTINVGSNPISVTYCSSNDRIYVTNQVSNSVSVINPSTNTVVTTISGVNTNPYYIYYCSVSDKIYTANYGSNNVMVITPSTNTVTATITVGTNPAKITYAANSGFLYVTNYNGNSISVINTTNNTVVATVSSITTPMGITYCSSNTSLYVVDVSDNTVIVINTITYAVITTISVGANPRNIIYCPASDRLYVINAGGNSVTVINPGTNTVITTTTVGYAPYDLVYCSSNSSVYIANYNANPIVSVVSTGTNLVTASINTTNSTSWNITRSGTTLTFSTAGVVRYSTTDTNFSYGIRARYTDTTNGTYTFNVNPITVDSCGTGYYVGLGNSITGTGIHNTKQLRSSLVNSTDITINGTPLASYVSYPQNAPAAGGAVMCPEEGLMFFNSADVGKTVAGSYMMIYQASTPCNIIPV